VLTNPRKRPVKLWFGELRDSALWECYAFAFSL
jgi:hypothetical protein